MWWRWVHRLVAGYVHAHADENSYSDAYLHGDGNSHAHLHSDAHLYAYHDLDADEHAQPDADAHCDAHTDEHSHAHRHADVNGDAGGHRHSHEDGNPCPDGYGYERANCSGVGVTAGWGTVSHRGGGSERHAAHRRSLSPTARPPDYGSTMIG
jgi:hypothetical protein